MIKNPKNGWSTFELGEFIGTPSYLTNVPLDLLEEFTRYWSESGTLAVYFDEEGTTFTLIANPDSIYIVEEKDGPNLIYIDRNIKDVTLELIDDVKSDLEGWAYFDCSVTDDEEYAENLSKITSQLYKLEKALRDRGVIKLEENLENNEGR